MSGDEYLEHVRIASAGSYEVQSYPSAAARTAGFHSAHSRVDEEAGIRSVERFEMLIGQRPQCCSPIRVSYCAARRPLETTIGARNS